jgi:uncharacterized protein (DUF2147 family)
MKKMLLALCLLFGFQTFAQKADDLVGVWFNEEKDGKVEVFKKADGTYSGKIVWVKNDFNEDGSKPKRDRKNPEEKLRNRVLSGLVILNGPRWDASDKEWEGGQIYDTKSGKTYSCYCKLQPNGTLYFKGFVTGMPFLGRSTVWTRTKTPNNA